MELAKTASKPIMIADTQDNPGAGGDSDTTGMLRALVRNKAQARRHGVIYDPESAKAAHQAGVGATVTLALGGKSGIPGDAPFRETFVVESLSDGKFVAPGPYYGGRTWRWVHRPACGSAMSASSSARTRRSSPTRRCTAMSASSRPSRRSWSTRARCISAPISNRSPKNS